MPNIACADALMEISGMKREGRMMSDKTLAEIWAEQTECWPDEITRRLDVLWEKHEELDDTVAEVVRLEAEHKYLSGELDKVAEEAIALRKENDTPTADSGVLTRRLEDCQRSLDVFVRANDTHIADNAALREKNEALERESIKRGVRVVILRNKLRLVCPGYSAPWEGDDDD